MTLLLLLACARPPEPGGEPQFLRGAVRWPDGRIEARDWRPGEVVGGVTAPQVAECVPLFHVELEDLSRTALTGQPPPGAALAFSPDGRWLAIGSQGGSLRVVDAATGAERARATVDEGVPKRVAWARDGGTLYVGEQSPDATLAALDPATLRPRWSVRLADDLETSALPPDDPYGLYSLPAVFSLEVLDDGSLLVAGAHGWTGPDGRRLNRSRLYRYGADGARLASWPREGPADAVLLHPARAGSAVLAGVSRSADGPAPEGLPIGGVVRLQLPDLTPRWTATFPVLLPHFREVFIWQAVGIGEGFGFVGLGDGRVFLLEDTLGRLTATATPGTPVDAAGVPIAAGVGFGAAVGDTAYFATTGTNIPWGAADPMARPPSAHPAEHTVHAVARDGTPRWSRSFEHALEGLLPSPDGRWLLVGASTRSTDTRTDLFGALVLDRADGRLVTSCATRAPVDFRPAWDPASARIAVAEAPFAVEGRVEGSYRVTVFR